jgi:LacI family transcriptional regulator
MAQGVPSVVILTSIIPQALREMLQGVLHFAQEHGPWRIYQQENRRWMYKFREWKRWGCTGIVAADYHSQREAEFIRATGIPTVVLLQPQAMRRPDYPLAPCSCCLWDSRAVGRMAAEYFMERRYGRFAFVGDTRPDTYWAVEREEGYREVLFAAGFQSTYHVYPPCTAREQSDWMREQRRMAAWLAALPKPVAVFAPNDRRGKQVLDACFAAGIAVPSQVAVLGVDDDAWICEATVPTLSSIRCLPFRAGYDIAAVLDAMMRGRKPPRREIPVEPVRVVTRQSTDWMAVEDAKVALALRTIRLRAKDAAFGVPEVVRGLGLSRRAAETRFKSMTGRTIREEIEFVRLGCFRALLLERDAPIRSLVAECGFSSETHLGRIFRARFGEAPGTWRRKAGNGG